MSASNLETRFLLFWKGISGQPLQPEVRFHATRRWRFDFAHAESRVAIEIEGGVWSGGRHNRGAGYVGDCEKYMEATLEGWTVFRLTRGQITVPNLERIKQFITNKSKT